jgi:ethanolamine utilization microcompartment shell protein EutL
MPYELYIAGEDIRSGDTVVISSADGKAYRAGEVAGTLAGNAVAEIREGFRIEVRDGKIREDDA